MSTADALAPVGTAFTFHSPYRMGPVGTPDHEFAARKGQTAYVTGHITEPDTDHDAEVLPMYRIRFEDGTEFEAWPEEVE